MHYNIRASNFREAYYASHSSNREGSIGSPMVVLYIFLGLFALIGVILALPLQIYLRYSPEDSFQFKLKFAWIPLVDSSKEKPEKPKEEKKSKDNKSGKNSDKDKKKDTKDKKKSSGGSSLLNFLGLGDIASIANAKEAFDQKGLLQMLGDIATAVGKIFARIGKLLGRGVFRRFDLQILVGDEDAADAAIAYGRYCGIIYPIITLLDSAMTFRNRSVDIRCDFEEESTIVRFDGQLNFRPWHFVLFLGGLVINYLKRSVT